MTVEELLIGAQSRLKNGWGQSGLAWDSEGNPVDPTAEQARMWSLLGALLGAAGNPETTQEGVERQETLRRAQMILRSLIEPRGGPLYAWDAQAGRTRREVVSLVFRGITAARNAPAPEAEAELVHHERPKRRVRKAKGPPGPA